MIAKVLPAAAALMSLSACMGSSTGNSTGTNTGGIPWGQREAMLIADVVEATQPETTLPTSGSANMTGGVALFSNQNVTEIALGDATMNVDFGTATFTGAAGNFVVHDTDARTGTTTTRAGAGALTYSGTVAGGAFGVEGDVDGSIYLPSTGTIAVEGDLDAAVFRGPDGYIVNGGLSLEDKADDDTKVTGSIIVGE